MAIFANTLIYGRYQRIRTAFDTMNAKKQPLHGINMQQTAG